MEVVCGPMFAGKSSELVRRYERALRGRQTALVLRHATDTRGFLRHGDGPGSAAIAAPFTAAADFAAATLRPAETCQDRDTVGYDRSTPIAKVVLVDEVQFLAASEAEGFIEAVRRLEALGASVTCFGLDLDASGRPFGVMPMLMAEARAVVKLTAVCSCGSEATRTQRLVAGATVGASAEYTAACCRCWFPLE